MVAPGQYRVRGKAFSDPRTGLTKEVDKRVEAANAQQAAAIRATLLGETGVLQHADGTNEGGGLPAKS